MRFLIISAAVAAIAIPASAQAQVHAAPHNSSEHDMAGVSSKLAEKLGDPATQKALAQSVRVMGEILLDMPLAPLADAAARMAGEDGADVDPDATLRNLAGPDAADMPQQIEEKLPQMMGAASAMAGSLETMLPVLRQMAAQMQNAMADAARAGD